MGLALIIRLLAHPKLFDLLHFFYRRQVTPEQKAKVQVLLELHANYTGTEEEFLVEFQRKVLGISGCQKNVDDEIISVMRQELNRLKRSNRQLIPKKCNVLNDLRRAEIKSVCMRRFLDTELKPLSARLAAFLRHWHEVIGMLEVNIPLKSIDGIDISFLSNDLGSMPAEELNEKIAEAVRKLSMSHFVSAAMLHFENNCRPDRPTFAENIQREIQQAFNEILKGMMQTNLYPSEQQMQSIFQKYQEKTNKFRQSYLKLDFLLKNLNERLTNFSLDNQIESQNELSANFHHSLLCNTIEPLIDKLNRETLILSFDAEPELFLCKRFEAFINAIQGLASIYSQSVNSHDSSAIVNQLQQEIQQTEIILLPLHKHFDDSLQELKETLKIAFNTEREIHQHVNDMHAFEAFTSQK